MKVLKKIIGVFSILACALFFAPNNVNALKNEDVIKFIAPDGKNATFKMKKPTSLEEAAFDFNGYINNLIKIDGYYAYGECDDEAYSNCKIEIYTDDYRAEWDSKLGHTVVVSGWTESYAINVTYEEVKPNSIVSDYMSKLNDFSSDDPSTYYIVEDLSLINYYLTSVKSELWNIKAPGRALKYSTINNITKGSNITYFLNVLAGTQDESLMYESAFGLMNVFYDGYLYGTKDQGLYLKRVIYIPQDTENTKEAFIATAQKRINDYLGNSSVVVSYGGLLSSLPEDSEDVDYPITSDGNYYNVKIGDRTYKFYIVKGSESQLVEPIYSGLDLSSKIEIVSKDSSIPLDTSLTVNDVEDDTIKDKIGTENYKSYDISLYSDANESKIEKLENGKFSVKIPVPVELNGKDLAVYYITNDNKIETHEVTIKDGYAVFETDHFSVYTLAEKVNPANNETNNTTNEDKNNTANEDKNNTTNENTNSTTNDDKNNVTNKDTNISNNTSNPKTGDSIMLYVTLLTISLFGFTTGLLYLRNKKAEK